MSLRNIRHLDWKLFIVSIIMIAYGAVIANSSILNMNITGHLMRKQVAAIVLGLVLLVVFAFINYQAYQQYSAYIYIFSLCLLILVLIIGKSMRGSRSWFSLGFLHFQPAEFARIAIVLVLGAYLDKKNKIIEKFSVTRSAVLLGLIIIGLILMQPDLGSTLVIFPIVFGMLYVAGSPRIHLLAFAFFGFISLGVPLYSTYLKMQNPGAVTHNYPIGIIIGIIATCALLYFILNNLKLQIPLKWLIITYFIIGTGLLSSTVIMRVLKEYQRKRLVTFLNPELDPLGAGYNIIQSKIAVGSGGLFGKGLFAGTQGQLGFLPERHTDFIFCLVAEELGFIGSFVLISLFMFMLWRIYLIAQGSRDRYGSLIATGFLIMFAFYCIMNIGVVLGLMPVTGIPLPLVSYGGSSLIMTCISIGIILNVSLKRYLN